MLVAWAPVLVPLLKVVGIVSALVLIFDDLITFVEGGDSAIGRLIDSLFGVGTATQYVHELREEWEAVVGAVERAIKAVADSSSWARRPPSAPYARRPSEGHGRRLALEAGQRNGPAALRQRLLRRLGCRAWQAPSPLFGARAPPRGPSGGARGGNVVHRTDNSRTVIQVTGITDPHRAAERVAQILEERQRRQRDGGHPSDAED